ncbi:HNH endonuclease [Mycobacterium sp. NPDC051198]
MSWSEHPTDSSLYHRTAKWKRDRKRALHRDGHQCQLRLPGCTRVATAVDLIRPFHLGGDPADMDNLQSACKPCHSKKTAREASAAAQRKRGKRPPSPHPSERLQGNTSGVKRQYPLGYQPPQ